MAVPFGLKLFIEDGQSNMQGRGVVSQFPANLPYYRNRIWNFKTDGEWQHPAREPLNDLTNAVYPVLSPKQPQGVGPALFCMDRLARYFPNFEFGTVPCAVGGSSIDQWARPADGVDTDTMYGAARARWEAAAEFGTIEGVLFYQGEADTNNPEKVAAWRDKFEQHVADVRSDTGIPNLPFICAELGPQNEDGTSDSDWVDMQTNQRQIVNMPRVAFVSNRGAVIKPGDPPHITTASQQILGYRMADMARVLGACQ